MRDELALFLWRRRRRARLQTVLDTVKLTVDFWTALYIVVPALTAVFYTYCKLLAGLPAWFIPEGEALLFLGLAWFMAGGNPRCYLNETDLTFLRPDSKTFRCLLGLGLFNSLAIYDTWLLLLIAGLFPFYMHLESISIYLWLGIGLWLIVLRTFFMLIIFMFRTRVSRLGFRLLFFLGIIAAWNRILLPFVHGGGPLYPAGLLGIVVFMMVIALLVKSKWSVNWIKTVADETAYDVRLMGQLLGYAARPEQKRSGASIWSQLRLGIPFRRQYTLTYFYLKYFLRLKPVWQTFLGIGAVCLLVSLSSLSYGAVLGFLAVAVLMLGLLVRSVVLGNQEKLDQFAGALGINDRRIGLRKLYTIMMVPLSVFPVFGGWAGAMSLTQVLGGIVILGIWAAAIPRIIMNFGSLAGGRVMDVN